ncbi:PRA1 family protein B4-like [Silene latifolia]|uniref:PRA1 family protein B4-like n=1 Tax=Silene latifolia TaxID=37657 RepID=UPI003D76EC39
MTSTAPPIIPTTIPTTLPTSNLTQPQPQTTTPTPSSIRTFLTRLHDSASNALSHRRPWAELLDRTSFSQPESLTDAASRIRKNYSYFRVNYLTLITLTLAASLAAHPFSLLTLAAVVAAWCFLYLFRQSDQPLVLFNREFSDTETLLLLGVFSVFAVFLTSVGSVLLSALVIGVGIVCVHGAFRVPEDLFLDDQDSGIGAGASVGFLSFLGAATKSAPGAGGSSSVV